MKSKKTLKTGAFQFTGSGDIHRNLSAIERAIKSAAKSDTRLLLTQECALCGYPPVEVKSISDIDFKKQNQAYKKISELSRKYNMFIALGLITYHNDLYHNSVNIINPNGKKMKPYYKRALWGWDIENFIPGNKFNGIYNIDGIKVGVRICYDLQFPEYFRELFCKKVDLCLISLAHVGSVKHKYKYDIEKSYLITRASENAMYVLSSNSTSDNQFAPTCLVNPDGKILKIAAKNRESLIISEIILEKPNFSRQGRIFNAKKLTGNNIKIN